MNFLDISKDKNISPSYTRIKVYDYLKSSKVHPTVDEIYSTLKPDLPSLSKTTVYNILKLFMEKDIITSINIDSNEMRYELKEEEHSHFKCNVCGKIYDIPAVKTAINYNTLSGYEIESEDVTLKGICPSCRNSTH